MDIEKRLEQLKKIKEVDPPPFLLTRIMEQIKSQVDTPAPATWRLAFLSIAIVVVTLNVFILINSSNKQNIDGMEEVINSMNLSTTNDLYHE